MVQLGFFDSLGTWELGSPLQLQRSLGTYGPDASSANLERVFCRANRWDEAYTNRYNTVAVFRVLRKARAKRTLERCKDKGCEFSVAQTAIIICGSLSILHRETTAHDPDSLHQG